MPSKKIRLKKVDMRKNIEWLMFFRVLIVSILLGASVVFQYTAQGSYLGGELVFLYILIGFYYFLTAVYIFLIRIIKNLSAFAYIQIIIDTLIISCLVFITGGIESIFTFFYIPSIISASIILYRSGGFITASLSGILYGVMIDLDYYGIISPLTSSGQISYREGYVFYNIFIYITAFYLVAFLSGYLSEQLKRTGEELIEKEINYEELKILNNDIIQNMQTGLITINSEGRIISFNRQAEMITAMSLEEVYLRPIEEVIPDLITNMTSAEQEQEKGGLNRWTTDYVSREKIRYTLGFSFSPLQNTKGQSIGRVILFQDITRIKEMEQEIKRSDRLATLGALAANLAHEIRNPLASMSGSIQLLKKELPLEGQNKNLMDIVLQEIVRLNHLITDFLLFAKGPEVKREVVDIKDILYETIAVFKNTPKGENRIKIETSFSGDTKIEGDFMQLKQVLWNILINSAESIKDGGEIKVTADGKEPSANGALTIRIEDNGDGINEDIQGMVFDPFFSTKEGGTGLGLATVRKIVEAHSGTVNLSSEINKGTRVIIRFPKKTKEQKPKMVKR